MNGLFAAAAEIQEFMLKRDWRFCIIGGLAVARWGEPWATQDVDITLLTGFGGEASYVKDILGYFAPRTSEAEDFAIENRVLLINASNGTPIDISLGGIPFEERLIERATPFAFAPNVSLITCSAEDLVVLKTFAGREKDWAALDGVLVCQEQRLDWDYIEEQLLPLCELKGTTEALTRLTKLRGR